jgi:carbon storage regulator CsrA
MSHRSTTRGLPHRPGMLSLTRSPGQAIYIGHDTVITICSVKNDSARFGISAPPEVKVDRLEYGERKARAERDK